MAERFVLRLFVGRDPLLRHLAERSLVNVLEPQVGPDGYDLRIIDVREHPKMAEDAQILATPTLLVDSPPPQRRLIGDLTDTPALTSLLGLDGGDA